MSDETLIKNGVTFFLPCLNEEGIISSVIESILGLMDEIGDPYEILVVDDASTDNSVREVEDSQRLHPGKPIRLIRSPFWRGLGRNYFIAAQRAHHEYFMLVSGDGAQSPEAIRIILAFKGQADAIIPYFGFKESRTLPRRILSRLFTWIINLLSGHRLNYYNGPVLHKTENVRMWFAETTGFGYQAELLCRLLDQGISIQQILIQNTDRTRGTTKAFALGNMLSLSNSLFHIALRRLEKLSFRFFSSIQKRFTRRRRPTSPAGRA